MAQQYGESDPLMPTYRGTQNLKSTKSTCSKIGVGVAIVSIICVAVLIIVLTVHFWNYDVHVQYRFKHAAVAADAGPCSNIGSGMLLKGGSAVDAAIASLLCVNLHNPHSAGIGGGNFFMYYDVGTTTMFYYDAREVAPLGASEDMYNDDHDASVKGGLAVAVPGEIRGFWQAHQAHGKLDWGELFQPTIALARDGFKISKALAKAISDNEEDIRNETSLSAIFFNSKGEPLKAGAKMYRPQLAETLQKIADNGSSIFYEGSLAQDIVNEVKENGGIITAEDLQSYTVKPKDTIVVPLAGLNFHLPPAPSGGPALALILNILEGYDIRRTDITNNQAAISLYHHIVESFKFAYAARSFIGDPDFVDVEEQVANMTSKDYAAELRSMIEDCCTHEVYYYYQVNPEAYIIDDHGTSHISIVDQDGNAASVTSSVNEAFGAMFRGSGTGIIYNNGMDDFSMPFDKNEFNIPPPPENFIAPGKRALSSMVPVIAVDDSGVVQLVAGGSGGKKITTGVAQVCL
ncbi:glutathione hydrolase 1 proenzyme-like [Amphiura filiformis]|uniref:glutathione hydrolase 1 proenzyme-like n=1 Tax=Amphiura filiformis TaxID=82378 RepID=UPI003B212AFB